MSAQSPLLIPRPSFQPQSNPDEEAFEWLGIETTVILDPTMHHGIHPLRQSIQTQVNTPVDLEVK